MQLVVPVTIAIHALSSIFWAGATFIIARGELPVAQRHSRAVQGAAIVAVLSGLVLWHYTISGEPQGTGPRSLAIGALAALIAVPLQIVAARSLKRSAADKALVYYRVSAALLALTVVTMVISRFV